MYECLFPNWMLCFLSVNGYLGDPKIIPKNLNNIHIIQKVLPSKSSLDVSRIEKRITVPLKVCVFMCTQGGGGQDQGETQGQVLYRYIYVKNTSRKIFWLVMGRSGIAGAIWQAKQGQAGV